MIRYISSLPAPEWEAARPRRLCILGSTGSIGVNGLRVVESFPDMFVITALAAGRNVQLLAEQALRWRPSWLAVQDEESAAALLALLPDSYRPHIEVGQEGYARLASLDEVSCVLAAQVGAAGLAGAVSAALAGKVICLANKESLVLAGDVLRAICAYSGAVILPVDSEHNGLFQALYRREQDVKRLIITASGGPFLGKKREFLTRVTPQQALNHPNWRMGPKVTVDSASLMNKGLELIEAHHLYGVPADDIGVLVHPQSLVHALVEFHDGSLFAHMGVPDMRMPIAYCLAWPLCASVGVTSLELAKAGTLTFSEPDIQSFPCLSLALRAVHTGTDCCIALNAANEVAVAAFLNNQIGFMDIPELICDVLDNVQVHAISQWSAQTASAPVPPTFLAQHTGAVEAFARLAVIEHLDRAVRQYVEKRIASVS